MNSRVWTDSEGVVHGTSAAPASALDTTLLQLLEAGERYDLLHHAYSKSWVSLRCIQRGVYHAEWSFGSHDPSKILVRARTASDALRSLKLELERRSDVAEQEAAEEPEL